MLDTCITLHLRSTLLHSLQVTLCIIASTCHACLFDHTWPASREQTYKLQAHEKSERNQHHQSLTRHQSPRASRPQLLDGRWPRGGGPFIGQRRQAPGLVKLRARPGGARQPAHLPGRRAAAHRQAHTLNQHIRLHVHARGLAAAVDGVAAARDQAVALQSWYKGLGQGYSFRATGICAALNPF